MLCHNDKDNMDDNWRKIWKLGVPEIVKYLV